MKIVFHIGQPKTGSTTLQATFRANEQELLRQGILYPRTLHPVSHADLTVPILERVQRSLVNRLGDDYPTAVGKSRDSWDDVGEQVREHRPEVLLISTEMLFNASDPYRLLEMVEAHIEKGVEVTFLAYLRTPSEYYISLLQQQVKASRHIPNSRVPGLEQLERYSDLGPVVVRKFAREDIVEGDIVADAAQAVGINANSLTEVAPQANASVSAEGIILLQRYRQLLHFKRENVFSRDTRLLIRRIREEESRHPNRYTKAALKPAFAQSLDGRSAEKDILREKFGIDLVKDHGISQHNVRKIRRRQEVSTLMDYDPRSLDKLIRSCDLDSVIARHEAARS